MFQARVAVPDVWGTEAAASATACIASSSPFGPHCFYQHGCRGTMDTAGTASTCCLIAALPWAPGKNPGGWARWHPDHLHASLPGKHQLSNKGRQPYNRALSKAVSPGSRELERSLLSFWTMVL